MKRYIAVFVGILLVAVSGVLHGYWSHRWNDWTDTVAQLQADRLEEIPLHIGDWDGTRIEADPHGLPEELVGRGVSVRYVNQTNGTAIVAYLACGPTDAAISHVPSVCYPANGYTWCKPDLRNSLELADGKKAEFWISQFTRPREDVPVHLRVFWAWSDGLGWRTPGNPGREFRKTPILYKCYFVRQVASLDEPVKEDPCFGLMRVLLPALDPILNSGK